MRILVEDGMKLFLEGWKLIFAVLCSVFKRLFEVVEFFLEMGRGKRERGREIDCFNKPEVRPRPDPYIYSQFWLYIRGLAFTWDNPDFALIDPDDGLPKHPHQLKPNKIYKVRARIHNGSILEAVHTFVIFDVLRFGAGTAVVQGLGTVEVNVPPLGNTVAEIDWTTPPSAGHNCLRAIIVHPDDANPLNNLGQHNTFVAMPAGRTRKLAFHVGNQSAREQRFTFTMNAYRLPTEPLRPTAPHGDPRRTGTGLSRRSSEYLSRLRDLNDFAKFPVENALEAKLGHATLVLKPGEEVETFLEIVPVKGGAGRAHVNVNVMLDDILIGGVTAYAEEA